MNDDNHFFLVKTDNSRKIFSNINLDYSMIEIKPKDKLDFISFLEIDESFLSKRSDFDENLYKNLDIYLIHYSFDEKVGYSKGKLIHISRYSKK